MPPQNDKMDKIWLMRCWDHGKTKCHCGNVTQGEEKYVEPCSKSLVKDVPLKSDACMQFFPTSTLSYFFSIFSSRSLSFYKNVILGRGYEGLYKSVSCIEGHQLKLSSISRICCSFLSTSTIFLCTSP